MTLTFLSLPLPIVSEMAEAETSAFSERCTEEQAFVEVVVPISNKYFTTSKVVFQKKTTNVSM